jgi:hypothetical protein
VGESLLDDAEIIRRVSRTAANYRNGIFCPAELWNQVADSVAASTAKVVLHRLPADLQRVLREAYGERPSSLRGEVSESEVRVEIERWCKEVGPN